MYVRPLGAWTREVFLDRRLGGPVQDPLRRHGRQQPTDGRLPRPGRDLDPAGPGSRDRATRAFCVFYPLLALGLYFAFREPKGAGRRRRLRPGDDAPADRRGDPLPRPPRRRPPRRADLPHRGIAWLAFFAISAVALVQRLARPDPAPDPMVALSALGGLRHRRRRPRGPSSDVQVENRARSPRPSSMSTNFVSRILARNSGAIILATDVAPDMPKGWGRSPSEPP